MIESELAALFEAHDALVAACVAGRVSFAEFVAAYGDFPRYALEMVKATPDAAAVLRRFRGRIEFHRQVSQVLAGVGEGQGVMGVPEGAADFLTVAAFQRLRQLVARLPGFRAEPLGEANVGDTEVFGQFGHGLGPDEFVNTPAGEGKCVGA